MQPNLWFPVTRKERKQMKRGKEIMKHFHDVVFPDDTVAVVVGKPWDRTKYEYLFARGINAIPVELTDEQIDSLEEQVIVLRSTDPYHGFTVDVHIIEAKKFAELQRREKHG